MRHELVRLSEARFAPTHALLHIVAALWCICSATARLWAPRMSCHHTHTPAAPPLQVPSRHWLPRCRQGVPAEAGARPGRRRLAGQRRRLPHLRRRLAGAVPRVPAGGCRQGRVEGASCSLRHELWRACCTAAPHSALRHHTLQHACPLCSRFAWPQRPACDDQLQARATRCPSGPPPAVILSLVRLSEAICIHGNMHALCCAPKTDV